MDVTSSSFPVSWLQERYRFDAAARNPRLEQRFLDQLSSKNPLRLVDIGAGLGANCRYFMSKINRNQDWTLIEKDPDLAGQSLEILAKYAEEQGYMQALKGNRLAIITKSKQIIVRVENLSAMDLMNWQAPEAPHAILANAFFDLLSLDEFKVFVQWWKNQFAPLYASLNYTDMHFAPLKDHDEQMVHRYEQHMQRLQNGRRAMGNTAPQQMEEHLLSIGAGAFHADSQWEIKPSDQSMLQYLLNYMETALSETMETEIDQNILSRWIQQKKQQIENQELSLIVNHKDILCPALSPNI